MQSPFFEHLSVLAREYERLVAENKKLRSTLTVSHDKNSADSAGTCPHGGESFQGPNVEQQLLPSMVSSVDFGGEIDEIVLPGAPHKSSRQQDHNTAPYGGQIQDSTSTVAPTSSEYAQHAPRRHSYIGVGDVKDKIKADLLKGDQERPDVTQFYKTSGVMQRIARSHLFENLTLTVIGVYAVWMAVDADWNNTDSILTTPWVFIIADHVFCVFFTAEVIIRFCAFQTKLNCLKDAWFVFDTTLVLMMIAETWILNAVVFFTATAAESSTAGNATILRLMRPMRLTRLFRMARLVRMVPELVIMIKAIAAAARTVWFTLMLLLIILYVFGIGFKQLLTGTVAGDELFSSVAYGMHSLLMHATFLDLLADVMALILADSYIAFAMMYMVIVMSAVCLMNMLVGVLVEVISAVAAAEKEVIHVRYARETLHELLNIGDSNDDGFIDEHEFLEMLQHPKAVQALSEIEIDAAMCVDFVDVIFGDGHLSEKKRLVFADLMDALLQLRGCNTVTVKDLVDMRKVLAGQIKQFLSSVDRSSTGPG